MNTRQQILDATEQVMREVGLTGATTKEIAKAAGYAEGTIYKYFSSKQELFIATFGENLPSFVSAVQAAVQRAGEETVQANLEAIALATLSYYQKIVPLTAAFFADPELLGRLREWIREQPGDTTTPPQRVAAYIKREQELGRINKQANALGMAALLLGACFHHVFLGHMMGANAAPLTEQQFVTTLAQTLMVGLAGEQSAE